ncbi:MAG: mechanosensitive ion channel domain-containing protein [Nitrosospira sp.]
MFSQAYKFPALPVLMLLAWGLPLGAAASGAIAAESASKSVMVENTSPAAAAPALTSAVTPAQARHTLSILQDEKKRAELEQTLSAIAQATETGAQAQSLLPTVPAVPAIPAAHAASAEPAAEAAAPIEAPIELTEGGLVAQLFDLIGQRLDAAADQIRLTARMLLGIRRVGGWWQHYLETPERRTVVLDGLWKVAAILGGALFADGLLRFALARPRRLVEQRAAASQATADRKKAEAAARGIHPGAPPTAHAPDSSAPAASASVPLGADRHWSLLRRFPFALVYWVLELIPLAAYLAVAVMLLNAFGGRSAVFYSVVLPLVGAYSTTRIVLSIVHLMASPLGQGLRLMHISDSAAEYLNSWLWRIVVVAVFGVAIAEVALQTGATRNTGIALSKLVGLMVHIMLLIMVFRSRKATAAAIRGTLLDSSLFALRGVLADVWPFAATFIIVATWLLWSVGAENGFERALHIFAWSAAVIVGASLVSIFVLGAIDRAFIADRENASDPSVAPDQAGQAGQNAGNLTAQGVYHLLVHRAVSLLIAIVAFIALLQVWGVDTFSWFKSGSVGRHLASATATIAITCALAMAAWEALNTIISRRIERWTRAGDVARSARLRTLVPMLRSTFLFAIGMMVLLAALDQLGISIGPLLAGASIIGVALGFGSQKLVQDFITGIFLLMENAIQVGDFITVANVSGTVEHLSIRTVRLRAGDGALHVVPFSSVSTVTNAHRGLGFAAIRVSVRADSDIDKVFAAIRSVAEEMRADSLFKDLILADADIWGVDQVDGSTITVLGQIRTLDRGRWPVQRGFNKRILQRFREEEIQFANPQETKVVSKSAFPTAPAPEVLRPSPVPHILPASQTPGTPK